MKSKKPRFFQLYFSFTSKEKRSFEQFLSSPYHNRRSDALLLVQVLWDYKSFSDLPEKFLLWYNIYQEHNFDDQNWRLLLSYLSRQAEQFLAVEATLSNDFDIKMKVVKTLEQRTNHQLHEKLLRELGRILEGEEIRNAEYWLQEYQYQQFYYRQAFTSRPELDDHFTQFSNSADRAFLAIKLRQNMWLLNHEQVYKWGYKPTVFDRYIAQMTEEEMAPIPALLLYYYGIKVLQQPTDEAVFQKFTESLFTQANSLPETEARDLYLLAINFGVRQVNSGYRGYFLQVMELYQNGLEQAYLLRNGVLSRFTYHNIVTTALQMKDIAYAEAFVEQWTEKLERRFRDRMYNFNRAKIAYASKNYADALPFLQQANYHDPLLNLGARTLLLKIYFELEEWEVLHSHLDAFSSYLRRKPGISYHRTNYRNLISYTRRLLNHAYEKEDRSKLRQQIIEEGTLTEKDWLLTQLE